LPLDCIGRLSGIIQGMSRLSMSALFTALTAAFAVIAFASAAHGRWVITVGAAAVGAWMASLAWGALRRMRR
jgi:hypothetical protein